MANQSKGPLFITEATVGQINRMLQQIREELDAIQGLRGTAKIEGDVEVNGNVTINGSLTTGDRT